MTASESLFALLNSRDKEYTTSANPPDLHNGLASLVIIAIFILLMFLVRDKLDWSFCLRRLLQK